jgi:Bacterial mobilisation protein (MobC)
VAYSLDQNGPMISCAEILKTTVPTDIKLQAKAIAERESLSEATWLKRLVLREIRACDEARSAVDEHCQTEWLRRPGRETSGPNSCGRPILVRLRAEDRLLLDARAEARGLRPATYVSVLARSHLRQLAPLPKDELLALKRSIAELSTIGRNINQIAKAVNAGGRAPGSVREEFRAMLKICEALRDNTKSLLKANEISWQTGESHADL